MVFQEHNSLFTSDFNIDRITSVRQNWNGDNKFNRMDVPRRRYGLLYLTDHPAMFALPDGNVLHGKPGDLIMLSKGAHYCLTFSVPEGAVTHPLLINFNLRNEQGAEVELTPKVAHLCRDDGSLLPIFNETAQLYKSAYPAKLKAKVYELLGNIFPTHDTDQCCIGYINRHYTRNFSVPELAKRCTLSETAYRKRFKQLTGLSPIRYINRLKIEKACQMLDSGDIHPEDICNFLNFYSLPYFYKVFKDITGLTPNQYRKQAAQP